MRARLKGVAGKGKAWGPGRGLKGAMTVGAVMSKRALLLGALMIATSLAGCIGDAGEEGPEPIGEGAGIDHASIAAEIGAPVEMDHDHTDATLHEGSYNMEMVSWSTLDVELGENGFADFVFHDTDEETLVVVAIDGDTRGGFTIADASDPTDIQVLGEYRIAGNGIQEVELSPDGDYVFMNVQDTPPTGPGAQDCQVCIHVVDITDRTDPTRVSLFPVEMLGTHNIEAVDIDGTMYVFYTGQPLYTSNPIGPGSNPPPGAEVGIAQVVEDADGDIHLVKVQEYRHADDHATGERSFPHDIELETHPLTGQLIMWSSWWQGGAITVDVTDPLTPMELDVVADPAPSEVANIHQFHPEPVPRTVDGEEKLYAWSSPEIGQLDSGSGVIRVYDATDPADFEQIATWSLPGDVTIPDAFLMSPHTTDMDPDTGLVVAGHYHAGIWMLDATDPTNPRHVGYAFPIGDPGEAYTGEYWWKKPNFDPDGYVPNVFQAVWHDGLVWTTERGTGLYVYEYTGPIPGQATPSE